MKKKFKRATAGLMAVWMAVFSAGAVYGDEPENPVDSVQAAFYVSPDGDDDNPGTEALPFATLQKAQASVRDAKDVMTGDIVVYMRGGSYVLSAPLVLDEEDSGTSGHRVIFAAYENEKPVIEGGRDLTGWTLYDAEKNIYAAPAADLQTRQLYINGIRAIRARMEAPLTHAVKTAAGYTSDDLWLADLDRPDDVESVFKAAWTSPRISVTGITYQGGKAAIALNSALWSAVKDRSHLEQWYLENAYAFIDQAGEWYLDDQSETIYYKPRPGENMATARVTAPVLENLVNIEGSSVDTLAGNIRFEGIGFAYTTWMQPTSEGGWNDEQNNYKVNTYEMPEAAVNVQYAHDIWFERCDFSKMGGTGINLLKGVQNQRIEGNRFFDISGSAVNAGQTTKTNAAVYNPSDERQILKNNDIVNNYIHDIGVEYKGATAVTAAFPMDIDISHNEIFNIPYSGISFFGSVYAPVTTTKIVRVEDNFIHDLMDDGIFDGGAIYAFGVTGGTAANPNLISGNYIKNQMNRYATIYMDQSSDFWRIENNVVDLREVPIWDDIYDTYWAFANINTHDIRLDDNYSTTGAFWNKSSSDSIIKTDDHIYPDGNWPTAAEAIIANAGLEPAYQDIALGTIENLKVPEAVNLSSANAQTFQIVPQAEAGRGTTVDISAAQLFFTSSDPSVATVDANGTVTAIHAGKSDIVLHVFWNGSLVRKIVPVFVDDELNEIEAYYALENVKHILPASMTFVPGTVRQWVARGVTGYGQIISGEEMTFESSDPSVATVVYGLLTTYAPGTADITISASLNGITVSKEIGVNVVDYSDEDSLDVPAYSINKLIRDPGGWYSKLSSGTITQGTNTLEVNTPGNGYALYQKKTFGDELLSMNLKINATDGWPSIVLRGQKLDKDFTAADNSLYLICFKSDIIELHRFSGGQRTVFFGEIAGYDSLGAASYPNAAIPFHETHFVQAGAVNESGGVRIILNVDGQNVFTYLDTSPDRITEDGYFGLYARSGSMTLGETDLNLPGEDEWPIPDAPEGSLSGVDSAISNRNVTLTGAVVPNSALTLREAEITYDPSVFEFKAISSLAPGVTISTTEAVYGTVNLVFSGTGTSLGGYTEKKLFAATFKAKTVATSSVIELSAIRLTDRNEDEVETAPSAKTMTVSAPVTGGIYETFDDYEVGNMSSASGYVVSPTNLGYFTIQESPTRADKSMHLYKTSTTDTSPSTVTKIYSSAGLAGKVRVSYQVMKKSGVASPQSFVNLRDNSGKVIATVILDDTLHIKLASDNTVINSGQLLSDTWYQVILDLNFDTHHVSVQIKELSGANRTWSLASQSMQNTASANFSRMEYVLWNTRTGDYFYNDLAAEPVSP
ncbi:Ig-like domain-containing protein [Cohnella sp. GCM10020058]|uniref:Ig-like domain-containing protein n=1 Tax=Cohnella sp. GCM10020058 TaxID=3317330 RepID=UPI0036283EDA